MMYFEHFSYQVLATIISPQIYVAFRKPHNFTQLQKWKGFTQKYPITTLKERKMPSYFLQGKLSVRGQVLDIDL